MEQNTKPDTVRPYQVHRLTTPEFFKRRKASRQRAAMKAAVELVVVGGVHMVDVAADMGRTRQNLQIGVQRFMRTTEVPPVRMTEAEFEFAARDRRNADQVEAARLYLVEGYSVPEASAAAGVTDAATKDMVKRMRGRLRRANGVLTPPDRGEAYALADAQWRRPTAEEIEAMASSCVVRRRSALAYMRAMLVLVDGKTPSEVAKFTNTLLPFVVANARKVESEVNQYRAHMQFPKKVAYLVTMRQAVAKRITNNDMRMGVEHYLGKEADLVKAAAVGGVSPEDLAKAVRVACHEMARMDKLASK